MLSPLLGPQASALSVATATMKGLQDMQDVQDNAPRLSMFEKQVRTEHLAAFQIATAEVGADGLLQVALVAFDLKARAKLTQLLFFKYTSSTTQLRFSAGKATILKRHWRSSAPTGGPRDSLPRGLCGQREAAAPACVAATAGTRSRAARKG